MNGLVADNQVQAKRSIGGFSAKSLGQSKASANSASSVVGLLHLPHNRPSHRSKRLVCENLPRKLPPEDSTSRYSVSFFSSRAPHSCPSPRQTMYGMWATSHCPSACKHGDVLRDRPQRFILVLPIILPTSCHESHLPLRHLSRYLVANPLRPPFLSFHPTHPFVSPSLILALLMISISPPCSIPILRIRLLSHSVSMLLLWEGW
jgi:hypothetical protein